ncbi:MAG: hypothetical protein ABSA79_05755 [Candidatus Bathyarchaeia archaeon]
MPLTHRVTFKVQLQKQSRFQIPKIVRWEYKLEPTQTMKITLRIFNLGFSESFLGKMLPAGRVTVPRIVIVQLNQILPNLKDSLIEVVLEPV